MTDLPVKETASKVVIIAPKGNNGHTTRKK